MAIPEIDVTALAGRLSEDLALVDVRQVDEYEAGHVPGALLIPLDELPDRLGELPEGPLVFVCRSGGRSHRACEYVGATGRDVTNVVGGTLAWVDAGNRVVQGSDPS